MLAKASALVTISHFTAEQNEGWSFSDPKAFSGAGLETALTPWVLPLVACVRLRPR